MSDAWFKWQIAPDGVAEDGCHPDEAQALQSYLNNETTPQEAAQAITQPILSSENRVDDLYGLWGLFQNALLELSETHVEPLIILLQAIQDLPDPDLSAKPTETAPPKYGFTWKGLPHFVNSWADMYKQDDWRYELSETLSSCPTVNDRLKTRQILRAAHIHRANIEARLSVVNVDILPLDWGYEVIADALELDDAVLDFEIPAVREWIAIAGQDLYDGAKEGRESWALCKKRDMGMEDKKMSMSRLEFWEARMREYKEKGKLDGDSGKGAGQEMK